MTARARCVVAMLVLAATAAPAHAEITPKKIDIKAFRDELLVLQDSDGNTYFVKPRQSSDKPARVWFRPANSNDAWEQQILGFSADGPSWSINTWAPRIANVRPGSINLAKDGSYTKHCQFDRDDMVLTQLTGDKAKTALDRTTFMTQYMVRRAHLLARDDSGVYYYVDRYLLTLGGKGFRVFVGRKGAMKQMPLVDVASDTAGEVFSTKTGDLRFSSTRSEDGSPTIVWARGGKTQTLISLDVDANSVVIYSDLGIYKFLGTLCDNIL